MGEQKPHHEMRFLSGAHVARRIHRRIPLTKHTIAAAEAEGAQKRQVLASKHHEEAAGRDEAWHASGSHTCNARETWRASGSPPAAGELTYHWLSESSSNRAVGIGRKSFLTFIFRVSSAIASSKMGIAQLWAHDDKSQPQEKTQEHHVSFEMICSPALPSLPPSEHKEREKEERRGEERRGEERGVKRES